jgi:hypothetical protein
MANGQTKKQPININRKASTYPTHIAGKTQPSSYSLKSPTLQAISDEEGSFISVSFTFSPKT